MKGQPPPLVHNPAAKIEKIRVQFLVSAGEASSDMYAAGVVNHLASALPDLHFYGCAGPQLRAAGVDPVINASEIAVVGLAEVVGHLPRIYARYRELIRFVERNPPVAALLTDSPDFHLRLARHLKRLRVPVFYLVAPQVWAWREQRVKLIRQSVDKLFCLFPFEEPWFREREVDATYIGHPLVTIVRRHFTREEFFTKHGLPLTRQVVTLLPGSRPGEIIRHMPALLQTVGRLRERFPLSFLLATPKGFATGASLSTFREPMNALSIKIVENETWDCIGHADLALAASGTVTVEAAMLGTPMVTFYKVNPLSWHTGRRLVKVPFLSMVNLIAERQIVPELIQQDMTPAKLASAAGELLERADLTEQMRSDLGEVRAVLAREGDPLRRAAEIIWNNIPRMAVSCQPGPLPIAGRQ
ncbi:MAG: lipid-A-disaccharide synthase [Acidobacteriaceae bacterium]|nr:lipid-A-disaccharide synthase [Acidobacteriaceae bacterium]